MDYEELFKLPSGTGDIESVFKTARGSTYAHHQDFTTTRNRSGTGHRDKTTGIQARSGKTVFLEPNAINSFAGIYQNSDMATRLVPDLDAKGKPTGRVNLQLIEDYGPKKAGTVISSAPYKLKPEVGLAPMEVYGSESPIGSSGKNIHFGNAITEVNPRPAILGAAGKLGVAGALAGAATASKAAELGEVASGMLPSWLQALTYAKGAGEGEDSELAYQRRKAQADILGAGNRGQAYDPRKPFNPIALPDAYKAGGRVRLI
jgi:hypothetical protein